MPRVGECYRWADVPGEGRNYARFLDGEVAAVTLSLDLNPGAPQEPILVGPGPVRERIAEILCQWTSPFPVYVKLGVNQWEYKGEFVVDRDRCTASPGEIQRQKDRSERNDIVRVIYLRPAAP